ncbi:MAG: hypothetical protein IPL19_08955 [Sandaracinaceae bacterium]|nr:hypothetical protein [Sandaracinaceae bacterium]
MSDALLTATRLYLDQERVARDGDLVALFNLMPDGTPRTDGSSLTSIDWDPRHDAALLSATVGANVVAIETNDVSDPRSRWNPGPRRDRRSWAQPATWSWAQPAARARRPQQLEGVVSAQMTASSW